MNYGNKQNIFLIIVQLLADILLLCLLFFIFLFIHNPGIDKTMENMGNLINSHYKALILIIFSWLLISNSTKIYFSFLSDRFIDFFRKFFFQIFLFGIILFAVSGLKSEDLFTNTETVYFILLLFIIDFIYKLLLFYLIKYLIKIGKIVKERILIIGENSNTELFRKIITDNPEYGIVIEEHLILTAEQFETGDFADNLIKQIRKNKIDTFYICEGSNLNKPNTEKILKIAEDNFLKVKFIFDSALENISTMDVLFIETFPVFTYNKLPLENLINRFIKRSFDIIFSITIFVIFLWWLLPILSIAVFFSQGRPIFYTQKRNGLNGREFNCLKFRTMRPDKFNDRKPTERDDPRVTRLGRILRKTSLDELPQFFNVLKGEMSIVGPRPHMVSENESYAEIIKKYSLRHYVKPGITGLAQIRGYRGAIDSEKDMELRVRTDIYYVRNWSFLLDLLIIYKTVRLVLAGDENAI
ncbi:MAG: exopolysaccharide biosynthesis polyprenyl glycosylphosphotransferase [Weeksellaceae bacterium]